MKKLLKSTLPVFLMIGMMLGLTACGGTPLTQENAVGTWYAISATYTPTEGANTGWYEKYANAYSLTESEYDVIAAKDADDRTTEEGIKYDIFCYAFGEDYTLTADGKVNIEGDFQEGSWEIVDGKFVYTELADTINQFSAKWDNGKIVMTVNLVYSYGPKGTLVFTLEKLPVVA